jgi:hypothetical protein
MSVELVIRDGSPYWYLSPDIWVVPGSDPTGSPGSPIAGQPAYVWANVENNGTDDASGVVVQFWWANPSLQVTRSNATLIGTANTDVPAGGSQQVLCLVPWIPVMVNGGHECLIAVAVDPADPLPNPLPDAFDPLTYPQVAQKNLSVLAAGSMMLQWPLTIAGLRRTDKSVVIRAEIGGTLDELSLTRLGLRGLRPAANTAVEVGIHGELQSCEAKDQFGVHELRIDVPRGTNKAAYAAIRATNLAQDEYQLVRFTEHDGEKVTGGLAYVVTAEKGE